MMIDDAETLRFDGIDPVEAAADRLAELMKAEARLHACREIFRIRTSYMAPAKRAQVAKLLESKHHIYLSHRPHAKSQSETLF